MARGIIFQASPENENDNVNTWRYDQAVSLALFALWMIVEQVRRAALRTTRHVYRDGLILKISMILFKVCTVAALIMVMMIDILRAEACPSIFTVVTGMVLALLIDRPTPRTLLRFRKLLQIIFTADKTRFSNKEKEKHLNLYILRYDSKLKTTAGKKGSGWEYDEQMSKGTKRISKDVDFKRRVDPDTKSFIRNVLRAEEGSVEAVALGYALQNWLPAQAFHEQGLKEMNIEAMGQWNENKKLKADRFGMIGKIHGLDQKMDMNEWVVQKRVEFYGLWFHTYRDQADILVEKRLPKIAEMSISPKEVILMLEACMWEIAVNVKHPKETDPEHLSESWGIEQVQALRSPEERDTANKINAGMVATAASSERTNTRAVAVGNGTDESPEIGQDLADEEQPTKSG